MMILVSMGPKGLLMKNVLASIPEEFDEELIEELLRHDHVRIERILSKGHTSPDTGWYDQDEHEWVLVLEGAGTIRFEHGDDVQLKKGDSLNIPAHTRHKVIWTDPDQIAIWLAVFYA